MSRSGPRRSRDSLSSLRPPRDPLLEEAPEVDVGRANDLLERHLAHELGTKLLVRKVLAMGPPAHGRLPGWRLGRGALTVRAKLLHQLATRLLGESGGEADLPQLAIRSVQPQQQRTDSLTPEI